MKILAYNDNNANVYSRREEELEVDDTEWAAMSADEKDNYVREWALEEFEYGYEELESEEVKDD